MYVLQDDASDLTRYIRDEITFPGLIERGKRGNAAKRVQEWLCLHGFGLVVDSDFGGVTEDTVMHFQLSNGMPATGTVDAATWDVLVQPMVSTLFNPAHHNIAGPSWPSI
ncbi:MAG: peptidoglycan-binding domain-containing protein [Pseudomonadota bacterium]